MAFTFSIVLPTVDAAAGDHLATLPTDNPWNHSPNVLDGEVFSIWQVGDRVLIGGTFSQVANSTSNGGAVYSRTGLAAFSATTGAVDLGFAPVLDGDVEVVIPDADGSSVFIGGTFREVDGVVRRKVAKIDVATGALVTAFDVNGVNGLVRDMRLVGDTLIVGGLFTSIGSQPQAYLASVDAMTGAVTGDIQSSILGQHNGGLTKITKMETTPDGSRLMVIGNFTSIDGQSRDQIAMLDLTQSPAVVTPWHTNFFTSDCHPVFDTFMRDLDISEDGTFAVVTTTGAYRPGTSCDTSSRLEIDVDEPNVQPTWVSYTGGDTLYAVEIHDGVAFIGGHMRWVNNPFAGDRHGAGGVNRSGMAALDVETGLPYSWDPGRDRGVGLFDYHVTEQGIWAGSDTDRWNNELRRKLAFFPWSGGTTVARSDIGDLPNDIFQLGRTSGSTGTDDPSVLYRINAGGPALASADDGPDWLGDSSFSSPYRNSGSNTATAPYGLTTPTNHASVPTGDLDRPPAGIWVHERWDPSSGDEMHWSLPVAAGTPVQVRLYMANRCRCTNNAGERVFDIDLDGVNVVDDLDLTAQYGHHVGVMRSFDTTSDGVVDIRFRHGPADNPLVHAIEIIRTDVAGGGTFGTQDDVVRFAYDGATAPSGVVTLPGEMPWRYVRGAFMADDSLYTLHADGSIMRRTLDGGTLQPGVAIDSWSNEIFDEVPNMTGIFYDPDESKILYTLANSNSLYVRDFLAESAVIGATRQVASGAIGALDPSRVSGMFLGQGHLWFGDADTGNLMKMPYGAGAVSGTPQTADTSIDWRSRALFRTTDAQPNVLPTASATHVCAENVCDFDATGSSDSDGTIVSYDWDFGDGSSGTGELAQHAFSAAGPHTVTLTVTDDRGGVDSVQFDADPSDPPNQEPTASIASSCVALTCTFDGSGSVDPDGTIDGYSWDFGDGNVGSGSSVEHTYSDEGTYTVTLNVVDDDGATGSATASATALSPSGSALFRSATTFNVNSLAPQITVPADVEAGDQLVFIATVNRDVGMTTPEGWTLVGTEQDGSPDMTSWVFTRTADGSTAGAVVTLELGARSKSAGILVAYDNAAAPDVVESAVMDATSFELATPGVTVTVDGSAVLSYWADKSGGNTGWTLPPTVQSLGASYGSGAGRITAAAGGVTTPAGAWPGATASTADDGNKGVAWTIVLPPASGNLAPIATFDSSCNELTCAFDGSASYDPDGTIASFAWDFGDGTTAADPTATHDYSSPGSYVVSLTVTDDQGLSTTSTTTVVVDLAVVQFRTSTETNVNSSAPSATIPTDVQDGDQLVLFVSTNKATTATAPTGWTLLGTAEDGAPDLRSWVFARAATAGDAGQALSVQLADISKTSLVLLAYGQSSPVTDAAASVSAVSSASMATPSINVPTDGSVVISYWVDKTSGNTGWSLPPAVTPRASSIGTGGGRITAAAGDTAVSAGSWSGETATGTASGSKAIGWTVVVAAP